MEEIHCDDSAPLAPDDSLAPASPGEAVALSEAAAIKPTPVRDVTLPWQPRRAGPGPSRNCGTELEGEGRAKGLQKALPGTRGSSPEPHWAWHLPCPLPWVATQLYSARSEGGSPSTDTCGRCKKLFEPGREEAKEDTWEQGLHSGPCSCRQMEETLPAGLRPLL